MDRYTFIKLLDGCLDLTFSDNFALWCVWDFEDDVEVEFGVFFTKEVGDVFVEFSDAFS